MKFIIKFFISLFVFIFVFVVGSTIVVQVINNKFGVDILSTAFAIPKLVKVYRTPDIAPWSSERGALLSSQRFFVILLPVSLYR